MPNLIDPVLDKAAAQFRRECGFNNNEPIVLKSLLQKKGVLTVFRPLGDAFSGMALKSTYTDGREAQRFMLVNNATSLGKQHFTICHELYHLFIQPHFTSQVCQTGRFDKKDPIEFQADVFASYLLLPAEGIIMNIPDAELSKKQVSLGTVLYIEQLYACSRSALLVRLKAMGLINEETLAQYKQNVKRSALESGYSTTLYEPGNEDLVIGNYGSMAKQLYDEEKISQSHYHTLLSDLGVDFSKLNNTPDDNA